MTRILGIDPGSRITGFGIIDAIDANIASHYYVASGCIRLNHGKGKLSENLQKIFSGLSEIIEKYHPQEAAIENIFMHHNPGSALKLGQARGAAMVAVTQNNVPMTAEYSARQVKQSVVGYGAAKKEQVQHMVQILLKLSGKPQADAADALAVAICHANSRQGLGKNFSIKGLRGGRIR